MWGECGSCLASARSKMEPEEEEVDPGAGESGAAKAQLLLPPPTEPPPGKKAPGPEEEAADPLRWCGDMSGSCDTGVPGC